MALPLDFSKCIKTEMDAYLADLCIKNHAKAAAIVTLWLTERARKKNVPDLAQRLDKFTKAIVDMCEVMAVEYDGGKFVIIVSGSAEQTYKKLRLGTDWFEPDVDVDEQILAGIM